MIIGVYYLMIQLLWWQSSERDVTPSCSYLYFLFIHFTRHLAFYHIPHHLFFIHFFYPIPFSSTFFIQFYFHPPSYLYPPSHLCSPSFILFHIPYCFSDMLFKYLLSVVSERMQTVR